MFKLLIGQEETPISFIRRMPGAVSAYKNLMGQKLHRDQSSNAWLTHHVQIAGMGAEGPIFNLAGTIEYRVTETADGKQKNIKESIIPLTEGVNYSFRPLNEIIHSGVLEGEEYIKMSEMCELDISDSDILERIKHSIKTELDNGKVFGDFTIMVNVKNAKINAVTVVVRS